MTDLLIGLYASTRKGKIELCLSREHAFDVQAKAGIKVVPVRSSSSSSTYRYFITQAAAKKLVKVYGAKVTCYGKPVDPNDWV